MKKIPLIFAAFLSFIAVAQDFEVAPVVINFDANPGEIQQAKLNVRNHANVKQSFTFNLGDFEVTEDGKKKRMPASTSGRSLSDWLTVTPSFIELNPNESKEISVIITVPKNGGGSKWGMIYVQATTEQKENPVDKNLGAGIIITPRIAVLVNQSPKNNSNYAAQIAGLKETSLPEDSVRTFTATVENSGDKIIEANVHLEMGNYETASITKFKGKMERVYPEERRLFTLTLPRNAIKAKGQLAILLDYGHGTSIEGTVLEIEP